MIFGKEKEEIICTAGISPDSAVDKKTDRQI